MPSHAQLNVFKDFVHKEFLHIFRDVRTMMILLAMPVIQILLFGYAISTEVRNANVAVLAPHPNTMVQQVIQRFDASPYFSVYAQLHSQEEVQEAFQRGKISLCLCFNEDNSQIQLLSDGSEPNQAAMVTQYAQGILMSQMQEMQSSSGAAPNSTPGAAPSLRGRAGGGSLGAGGGSLGAGGESTSVRFLFNPQSRSAFNFVPGVMGLIMMLICAMMTSIAIVREKEQGTMEVLLASPLHPIVIILAKMVPYFTLSLVNLTTILLLSRFVLGVPIVGSLVLLIVLAMLYIALALAFGLLISNIVNSQMAAMLISGMGLMMPVMLLSGMVFPIESMPLPLRGLSYIVPARWFIAAVKKVMIQGCGFAGVSTEFLILALMIVVILAVALKKFKVRLG